VAPVKPGTIMFEIDGIPPDQAREALRISSYKLPCQTVIVTK